ncbi:pyridoxine 5'-phosphate synthase [bacterium]|nr:MAG: pyridoxine 5'-phosphate synthase [bacterium]
MAKLGVNVDHIATLRQARRGKFPDPVYAAGICERAGCGSIVAHLREDRRHINDNDVKRFKKEVKTRFNLEMSIAPAIVDIACRVKPHQATLVPEKRQELTTEGGLDIAENKNKIKKAVGRLSGAGIEVSLFIDPDIRQIKAAPLVGAKIVELHTGRYADSKTALQKGGELKKIVKAAYFAKSLGLTVCAGHGLDYDNVRPIAAISGIYELNIGYSIICRSVFAGLEAAVRQMLELVK